MASCFTLLPSQGARLINDATFVTLSYKALPSPTQEAPQQTLRPGHDPGRIFHSERKPWELGPRWG